MNEVVSVIVPIYNVEQYLDKCVDSILNQTYKNIEVILVDDGSPDNCGRMCDNYSKKDSRIKVIHKGNGGLSDARNVGIDNANGKYICFVDSDDYIENRYIELLYKSIKENNVDIAQCGIKKISDDEILIENIGYKNSGVKKSKKMLEDLYTTNWENIVVWNKMYLRELFNNVRFPKGKIHEDEYTTYKILYKTENVAILNEFLYNYRQNVYSITGKKFNMKRLNILEGLKERVNFFEANNEKNLYMLSLKLYIEKLRECYSDVKMNINDSENIQQKIIREHNEYSKYLFKLKNISLKSRIKTIIFFISPSIFYKLVKFKRTYIKSKRRNN